MSWQPFDPFDLAPRDYARDRQGRLRSGQADSPSASSNSPQRSLQKEVRDFVKERSRSAKSMMAAIWEQNKLAYFVAEWVARMDPMREHGSSRTAGTLPDPRDYKYRDLCALCVLERP